MSLTDFEDLEAEAPEVENEDDGLILSDDDFVRHCREELASAIGFDDDGEELSSEREKALNYYKGEMPDVPFLANRSGAVDTSVADAIETALPDILEVLLGGDDPVAFKALTAQDEEQAKVETEAVTHTVMELNESFIGFTTAVKDALLTKLGVFHAWVEEHTETEAEDEREGIEMAFKPYAEPLARLGGFNEVETEDEPDGQTFTARLRRTRPAKCIKWGAWPSEDFAFARDTVGSLKDATYFALRSRPRAQKLVEDGYDPDLVDQLPGYTRQRTETAQARDTAGESEESAGSQSGPLRQVEVVAHFLRIDADGDGKTELWRIETDAETTLLLKKERVEAATTSAMTPFIIPHRFMGLSLADNLLEIQRIKTALLRMLLDSGYFALNQRHEVAMAAGRANQFTLTDLMSNTPGRPVRSDDGQSVRPIQSGGITYDIPGALEYVATMAESRTGIVRNAQGLNPDTFHDTASGAMAMIGAAQKRVRFIARTLIETGIKDLFLIVHDLMRRHGDEIDGYALGREGAINPQGWRPRRAINCEIGVGSGGREHDIAAGNALLTQLKEAVTAQGGLDGPLTTAESVRKAAIRQTERMGFKEGEQYWTPAPPPDPSQPPPEPPEVQAAKIKAQSDQQIAAGKAQFDAQAAQVKAQTEAEARAADAQLQAMLAREEMAGKLALERERLEAEMQLKREQYAAELALKEREMAAELELKREMAALGAVQQSASVGDVEVGGEPG